MGSLGSIGAGPSSPLTSRLHMAATYSSLVGLAVGGKYEIRRLLGIGGMGVVCEALNIDLQKRVALKLIDKTMKESELIVERFRREARAAGQIQSEHIVDVFDMGADERVGLYMVMEHLVGEDLQTRLEREVKLDVNTAVMVGHQIARGLAKAHAAGVIHRDLKPANVFLTARDNGQLLVKLLDFGVSKLLSDRSSARITGTGAPIGTPLYMSPEQAEGNPDVDGRADIWSLGAVLYEALSGDTPVADKGSYHGTIVGILTSRPRLLKSAAPWVPSEICAVVDAMLVHDRDARLRDADTVTRRLLEAFPAVLPDGTGRHTAVIVSQAAALIDVIDATGDTEIFRSQRITSDSPSRPSNTPSSRGSPLPPAPASGAASDGSQRSPGSAPRSASGEGKTIPHPPLSGPSRDGVPSSANATRAATSVPAGTASDELPIVDDPAARPRSSAPAKTEPFGPPVNATPSSPPVHPTPSSYVRGVFGPTTLSGAVPLSDRVPDTERDVRIAQSAERRRYIVGAGLLGILVAFSFAGFFLGRRASKTEERPSQTTATSPMTGTGPAALPPAYSAEPTPKPPAAAASALTAPQAPALQQEAVVAASAAPSASAKPAAKAPRKAWPRRPPAAPPMSAQAPGVAPTPTSTPTQDEAPPAPTTAPVVDSPAPAPEP
jgi:serine/threonine protein kinase